MACGRSVNVWQWYLVLVGWVELVPRLWVVLLVPAVNVERFRACRVKRGRRKRKDRTWGCMHDGGKEQHKEHAEKRKTWKPRCFYIRGKRRQRNRRTETKRDKYIDAAWRHDLGEKKRWLWDEVNSAQWLGSAPLFINQSLDFTALHSDRPSLPLLPPLAARHATKAQTKRPRETDGRAGTSPPLSPLPQTLDSLWERERQPQTAALIISWWWGQALWLTLRTSGSVWPKIGH